MHSEEDIPAMDVPGFALTTEYSGQALSMGSVNQRDKEVHARILGERVLCVLLHYDSEREIATVRMHEILAVFGPDMPRVQRVARGSIDPTEFVSALRALSRESPNSAPRKEKRE